MHAIQYHYSKQDGIELILQTTPTEKQHPWHFHLSHWTAGIVLSGTVTLETRDTIHLLAKGDHFIVRPREVHQMRLTPESSLAVLCVDLSKAMPDLKDKLRAALIHLQATLPGSPLTSDIPALMALGQSLAARAAVSANEKTADTPITAIVNLLIQAPETDLSLAEMAKRAGYSRWHFLRLFRKETGMTPHAFQLACRLRQARSLIRQQTPPADAALSAGFADQSHLHKAFRQHHGLTPGKFRKVSHPLEKP